MQPVIDISLGLNANALRVVREVAGQFQKQDAEKHLFRTSAWYNGRERGVVIDVLSLSGARQQFNVVIVENRNSDQIMVYDWVSEHTGVNPPTVADFTDEAYETGKSFSPGSRKTAANYVASIIKSFLSISREKAEAA